MQEGDRARQTLDESAAFLECFTDGSGKLTPSGAAVLRTLEKRWFASKTTARPTGDRDRGFGPIDPLQMAINEGKRVALAELKSLITTSYDNARFVAAREAFQDE